MHSADAAPVAAVPGARVLVAVAPYYREVADHLIAGVEAALKAAGASWERRDVPGSFELPGLIALTHRLAPGAFDGFVALGCVVRGETTHYDYVCGESARALMDLSARDGLAIGYGIVTVETLEQALARARPDGRDHGGAAARACAAMIAHRRRLLAGTAS